MAFELATEHAIPEAHLPAIERLLVGSVDLHCHSGPSLMPRALDSATALEGAAAVGMRLPRALVYIPANLWSRTT